MASSSSSAHRLSLDREPAHSDRLPAEYAGPTCEYFGDDAPTLELLLPTTQFQLPAPAAPAPMARLRLQRRQVKRDDPDRDDD